MHFDQQGQVRGITLHYNPAEAETALEGLQKLGMDLDTIADQRQSSGEGGC